MTGQRSVCPVCDGDGYVEIVDDWGAVVGPAPCPNGCDLRPELVQPERENDTP